MSKKSKQTPPSSPTEPRRNRHLRQREARMQRWVTIGVGVAVGVVAVMVLGASLWGFVIQPRAKPPGKPRLALNLSPLSRAALS